MRTALLSATFLGGLLTGAAAETFRDSFDRRVLDLKFWSAQQVEPRQIGFVQPGRCGGAAIRITLRPGEGDSNCEGCQRAEVRVANAFQPKYGEEIWYGFSFRIESDGPRGADGRTVIGQFKGPQDSSPFLAQRFDNGVFQITVEDQGIRRIIAKSDGDADQMVKAQSLLSTIPADNPRSYSIIRSLRSAHRIARTTPDVASVLFTSESQSGLRMPTGPDYSKTTGDKMNSLFGIQGEEAAAGIRELLAVSEIERYIGPAEMTITPAPNAVLPDPRDGWVDMTYRVRGGRADNLFGPKQPGEIDIWANGRPVVSVKGNFGNQLKAQPGDTSQYFKFGIYRDSRGYEQRLFLDEFAQGKSRNDVSVPCTR